jgi:hypothetical protein
MATKKSIAEDWHEIASDYVRWCNTNNIPQKEFVLWWSQITSCDSLVDACERLEQIKTNYFK